MAYRRRRLSYRRRRRRLDIDVGLVKKVSETYHKGRTGHYPTIGNPLVNYKSQTVKFPVTKGRREPPKMYSEGNKIFTHVMAQRRRILRARPRRRRRLTKVPLGIPSSKVVRFRVTNSLGGLGSANGTLAQWLTKANSLNDPLQGLSAGLPLYLDQWASMYTKYIVLGSRITYKPQRVSSTGSIVCGIHLADYTTSLADHDYYKEAKLSKSIILTDQRPSGTITFNYSGKRFWKVQSLKDDSEQEATFSTTPGDPTDIAYFHIYNQDLSKGEAIGVEGTVSMDFIVLLTNPVVPARSSL